MGRGRLGKAVGECDSDREPWRRTTISAMSAAATRLRTARPVGGGHVVLYDGRCRFCTASARRLRRLTAPTMQFLDFHTPGVLQSFPGISKEACQRGLQLVTPAGSVYSGAEAIARALSTSALLSPLAAIYFIPGLRSLFDRAYALIARNRYRIMGMEVGRACEGAACSLDDPVVTHPTGVNVGNPRS